MPNARFPILDRDGIATVQRAEDPGTIVAVVRREVPFMRWFRLVLSFIIQTAELSRNGSSLRIGLFASPRSKTLLRSLSLPCSAFPHYSSWLR